jgi:hypothetical protein
MSPAKQETTGAPHECSFFPSSAAWKKKRRKVSPSPAEKRTADGGESGLPLRHAALPQTAIHRKTNSGLKPRP